VVPFALRVRCLVLVRWRHFPGQADLGRGFLLVDPRVMFQLLFGQVAGQRAVTTVETARVFVCFSLRDGEKQKKKKTPFGRPAAVS